MRLAFVASATLSLLLVAAPGLRAQDDMEKPAAPEKKKKDDKKPSNEKKEMGDEGDDEDDRPKKPVEKLPLNPFAKAKKGDWSVCLGKMKAEVGGQKMQEKIKLTVRVKETDDKEVTCTMQQAGGPMGGQRPEQKTTFSLKENPPFDRYMSMSDQEKQGGDELADWKVEDDKKTVGGKEFACKKITAKIKDKMGTDAKLTMWVTDETKGWGMVAMSIKGSLMGGGSLQMDVELKGYGNGDKADFGKKPEDKGDDEGDEKDEDAPKDGPKDDPKKDKKKKSEDDE
jgi:hypothetical protein